MNKNTYLNRIGINENGLKPNLETLNLLQKLHLLNIPFENLDIHWKTPIVLDTEKFFGKIIDRKRGGFCYELNGLFNELLKELGFQTKLISARVFNGKEFGAEYDHLAILVKIGDAEYLTDVGFGDFSAEPLKFVLDKEQTDANGTFLIKNHDDEYFEVVKKHGENWQSEYIFKDLARDLSEFAEMCNFHQTSPASHFTRGKLCSLMIENGRKTLTDKKFIQTKQDEKNETEIDSEDEFNEILAREFSIKKKI
ncbi:MAG TPA: arylamine N-acetyltransferase [Pyrinomonadaceae bacterium]|nr:arylamine N-acetyltransferase [Pyrinomonadaceae bacterium]